MFSVSYMGILLFVGIFLGGIGMLMIDFVKFDIVSVLVIIFMISVMMIVFKLIVELNSVDWFDIVKFLIVMFKLISVKVMNGGVEIIGMLMLYGVIKFVVLCVCFFGIVMNLMSKKFLVGFLGCIVIKCLDFGVSKYVLLVLDEIVLVINVVFEK